MIFATPLALGSAIYTAYFMTPGLRGWIKPSIELIAAMPTVILGFLGALWLAPLIEQHLFGTLITLLALPRAHAGPGMALNSSGAAPLAPAGSPRPYSCCPGQRALRALQHRSSPESSLFEQSFRPLA